MPLTIKSVADMILEIKTTLMIRRRSPAFTLLLGSGFSHPVIPTPTKMLTEDLAFWRYCNESGIDFGDREDALKKGTVHKDALREFELSMWRGVEARARVTGRNDFVLTADGLPDLTRAESIGAAYQLVMSGDCAHGLPTNEMRRQYLRDVVNRSHPQINLAHIFLAGILDAQETWKGKRPFCRTIFTTNFDPLLQRSLQYVNKLYFMTDRPDTLEAPDDNESDAIHLVYTHGSVHRYDLVNTALQIDDARKRNKRELIQYFETHGVIVLGYSGWLDTTMAALLECSSFDAGLYWCDIIPAGEAETRLRPEALELLNKRRNDAFYVPIVGADDAMFQLHRALTPGHVLPQSLLSPITSKIAQMRSIVIPASELPARDAGAPLPDTHATVLLRTIELLEHAQKAFENPALLGGKEEALKGFIARLMNDAFSLFSQGKNDEAVALWTRLAGDEEVPPAERSLALVNRAAAKGHISEEALPDYTTAIDTPETQPETRAFALACRGLIHGIAGRNDEAIADYSAALGIPEAEPRVRLSALLARATVFATTKDHRREAIADLDELVSWPSPPPSALIQRGVFHAEDKEWDEAIRHYTTVIQMTEAPVANKTLALRNRASVYVTLEQLDKAAADCSAIIDMPDMPEDTRAMTLVVRGVIHLTQSNAAEAVNDLTEAIASSSLGPKERSQAFANRALAFEILGRTTDALNDYASVLQSGGATEDVRVKAVVRRAELLDAQGTGEEALAAYTQAIDDRALAPDRRSKAIVRRGELRFHAGDIPNALLDFDAVLTIDEAPPESRAFALTFRGWLTFESNGDPTPLIDDSRAALELTPDDPDPRMNLALGLLIRDGVDPALPQYEELIARTQDQEKIVAAIEDLEKHGPKTRTPAEIATVMALLRAALDALTPPADAS